MSLSTLLQIKKKVRRLTASPSTNQLSESDLEEYIDTFLENDFPSSLKTWNLHDTLDFYTVPNEDRYTFDTDLYHAVLPPLYVDGYQCVYSQSRDQFFNIYPTVNTQQTGSTGTGIAGPYAFTISALPIVKRSFTLSVLDDSSINQIVYDVPQALVNNVGDLIDSSDNTTVRGTVNYVTGAVSVTWPNTVSSPNSMTAKYQTSALSRPNAALFFNNYFTLRPIPDKVYRVSVEVYKKPTQLLSAGSHDSSNTPDINQWWQYIAFGAAIKVLQDRQDVESIQNLMPFFQEQENLVLYRTATQQAPDRTATIYSDDNYAYQSRNGGF